MWTRHRAGVVPGCGADQDDPAALALLDKLPAYGSAQQERAPELDVDLEIPLRIRHINDLVMDTDAGAMDQNVQSAVGLHRAFHRRVHLVAVADVGPDVH